MNPSPQRIRDLFDKADYSDPYWKNFSAWLSGNSHKDKLRLLATPGWNHEQLCTMLVLMHYVEPTKWFSWTKLVQNQRVLEMFRKNRHENDDGVQTQLSCILTGVVKKCWAGVHAQSKFLTWNHWRGGIQGDNTATDFMMQCMNDWKPTSAREREIKIEALVATFDELVDRDNIYLSRKDLYIQRYGAMMREEVDALAEDWPFAPSSIQTWRQLQGYPDFLKRVEHPHPWMESLSVIRSGTLVRDLPLGYTFTNVQSTRCERLVRDNALNPLDKPLAMALTLHFAKEPVTPAPDVVGIYAMLDGLEDMTGALLSLAAVDKAPELNVDSALFEAMP